MTETMSAEQLAATFRERAAGFRATAQAFRDDNDPAEAADYERAAIEADVAAETLELAALPALQPAKPPRMTVGRALEMLLESRGRAGAKSGAVTIGRSARGAITWEITATADPDELDHLTAALDAAIAAHDRLAELYPAGEGE